MKKIFTFFLFYISLLSFGQIQSNAPWNKNIPERRGKETLKEISQRAEEYFRTIDRYKKSSGFKPFKRWEYHWSHYIKQDGTFTTFEDLQNAWLQKKALGRLSAKNNADRSNWLPLGPLSNSNTYNATDLKQTGQGRVNTIAVDPNNPDTYYIGAPAGGIWKSTDAGINWTPLTDNLPHIGVSGIAINPDNSNIIYIATGDDDANDSFTAGVWKSTDGGKNWSKTGSITGAKMNEIYINPNNTEIVLVATSSGVQKTTNGGTSWVNKLRANIDDLKMKPNDPTTWYATSDDTFYRSTDGGENFTTVSIPSLTNSGRITMDVTPANPNYVYFVSAKPQGGSTNSAFNGVYKSTDSGASFSKTLESSDIFGGSSQAWFDLALTVSDSNENLIFVGVLDIWRSNNGGDSFTQINEWFNPNTPSYTHADIHFLRYFNGKFFAGTDGGIFVSTNNGDNFKDLTKNIAISQFYRLSISQETSDIIAGGLQDNGGFGYDGNQWRNYHGGDGMEGIVDTKNSNIFYGFTQYGRTLTITNNRGGSVVTQVRVPSEETGPNDRGGEWITPMVMNSDGELFAGYSHLYKLENNSWTKVSNSFGSNITHIEVDPNNNDIIYATTGSSLFKSTNRGQSFANIFTFSGETINSIEISNNESSTGWVTTNQKVYKTTSLSGFFIQFTDITGNLPFESKLVIKHHKQSGNNTIYLGTNLGVYFINDDLTEWQTFHNNLPNVQIRDLDINEKDSRLYAATYGRGIFRTNIPKQGVLSISDNTLLNGISIFPNPAESIFNLNRNTTEALGLKIYDLSGKEVFNKKNMNQTNFSIDLSNYSKGIYILKINSDNRSATKKLILK